MLRFDRLPRSSSLHTEAAGTAPPDAFGPFRVLHQLGAGTLGPVFRAYDPDTDRLVAVKLFALDLPPERIHQLAAEFERLVGAELNHPALAAPVAAGMVGASVYLAQEFVSAESLDLAIREYGPAPPADAVRVATQLAGALDFAAVVSVTHGAMHPRDVLLSAEETRLTGIGVAAALERVGVSAPIRRPYTAPERVAGQPWGRAADIFSLAALIHELLSGRRISGTGAQAAAALGDVTDADMSALRAVFARALADDPHDRFATALEFAEALKNAFREAKTIVAPSATRPAEPLPATSRLPLSDPEPMPPLPVRATDTDFPLAPAVDAGTAGPSVPEDEETIPMATVPGAPAIAELDLRGAEAARYSDVESAPAVVPQAPPPVETDDTVAESDQPTIADRDQPTVPAGVMAVAERPSGRGAAMVATLVVGMLLGFAGGYLVGMRGESTPAPQPAAAVAPSSGSSSAREFTEGTLGVQPKPDAAGASTPAGSAGVAPAQPTGPAQAPAPTPENQTAPSAAAEAPEPPAGQNGRILVRSTPAGATVFVDGREAGRTPVAVRDLARGTHRVRIVLDGYAPEERRVAISRSRPAQSLTIPLTARRVAPARAQGTGAEPEPVVPGALGRYTGAVVVESRPAGAEVFIDNRLAGRTPLTVDNLRAGEHVIRLEHQGYRRWSGQVRVIATERTRVTASLEEGR